MLRDRVICGMKDETLRKRLLADSNLTLKRVIDEAQASESASRNIIELRNPEQNRIHQVSTYSGTRPKTGAFKKTNAQNKKPDTRSAQQNCFRCKGRHAADVCKFRDAECNYCHKKGHIRNACITMSINQNKNQKSDKSYDNRSRNHFF